MLLKVLLASVCITEVCTAYSPCVGPTKQFDGYTYIIDPDTGQRVWTHCAFFNPRTDHTLCGRPERAGEHGYLCDPDNLLKTNTSRDTVLDQRLRDVQSTTATICFDSVGNRVRIIVAVAVIDRIRIPELRNPDLCINDCGQLQPWRNGTSSWYPNDEEQYAILQNFADGLRKVWKLGKCENEVIVLYCKEFNKVQFSFGAEALSFFNQHQIQQIRQKFMSYLQDSNYPNGLEQGLFYLLARLQETLKSVKVAVIVISSVLSLVLGGFVWFLVYAARYYYDVTMLRHKVFSYPGKAMSWLFKLGSGFWLVEQTILLMVVVSQKWSKSCLLLFVIIFLVCILLYSIILTEVVSARNEPNLANN